MSSNKLDREHGKVNVLPSDLTKLKAFKIATPALFRPLLDLSLSTTKTNPILEIEHISKIQNLKCVLAFEIDDQPVDK
uniref:Uncharacterized protein n=1 Tax=Romanomermis culicivorax TaxID=13658 RepID=A0A915JM92_ROMCU